MEEHFLADKCKQAATNVTAVDINTLWLVIFYFESVQDLEAKPKWSFYLNFVDGAFICVHFTCPYWLECIIPTSNEYRCLHFPECVQIIISIAGSLEQVLCKQLSDIVVKENCRPSG